MILSLNNCVLRQYVIVIIANFTYLKFGLQIGWPSPVIAKLKDVNQTVLPQPISDYDASWVVSVGILIGTIVTLFSGFLMDHLGRKLSFVLVSVPRLVCCLLMVFASEVWMLILGRSLNGISDIFGIGLMFTYTSEIASKEIRGALGTIAQMSFAVGTMVMLTIGPFLSYLTLNIINTVIVFVLTVPVLFLPETPYFLYSKGHKEKSLEVLTNLRGSKEAAFEELKEYSNTSTSIDYLTLFKNKTVWKSLGAGIFLSVGAQLTGFNSLTFYLQSIFASTHTSVTPEISSLVIGCVELIACSCIIFLTDRSGRKPILILSLALMALGMIGLGSFFCLKEHNFQIEGFLNYLPLLSVILTIFCYNAGIGCIMMLYIAELFDGSSRAFGVSISVCTASIVAFLLVRYFGAVTEFIGPMYTYYGFSIGCIILCLFIAIFLPETKGKTFSEIQKEMRGSENGDSEKSGKEQHVTSM